MEQERGSTRLAGGPGTDEDLATRATDVIEVVVTTVRDRAVRPALLVARAVVFGLIVLTMLLVVATAGAIGLVRLLDVYAFGGRVWASDAVLGAALCLAGGLAWAKRRPKAVTR